MNEYGRYLAKPLKDELLLQEHYLGKLNSLSPHSLPPFCAGFFQHKNKVDAEMKD
jgi:hypothetical protein